MGQPQQRTWAGSRHAAVPSRSADCHLPTTGRAAYKGSRRAGRRRGDDRVGGPGGNDNDDRRRGGRFGDGATGGQAAGAARVVAQEGQGAEWPDSLAGKLVMERKG